MDKPPRGSGAMPPGNFFWPIQPIVEPPFVIRVLWQCGCHVLKVRENIVAESCIMYSSLIIVKSLQLRGRRQIAEPRKYCLMRNFFFFFPFDVCFLYFCFSQVGNLFKFPTVLTNLNKNTMQLIPGFCNSFSIIAVHDKDQSLSILKVMSP